LNDSHSEEADVRRVAAFSAATLAGLIFLFSFKATPNRAVPSPPAVHGNQPGPIPSATGRHAARTVTGPAVRTPFGSVQVRISLAGHRLADVRALMLPGDFALSQQISSYAGPLLRQEALKAQSSRIDVVSGATYTTEGYRQSLQAALDRSHG
jgi:uncharacterized protein with FMN-binding domain